MKRQFVATVYVVHDNKILLLLHKKFNKWLPPGGHLDPNELPNEAAIRETKEETGLTISLVNPSKVAHSFPNASTIPSPYFMQIEDIPASEKEEAHQHIDFIFLGKYERGKLQRNEEENHQVQWFSKDMVHQLQKEMIFPDTREVIDQLLI